MDAPRPPAGWYDDPSDSMRRRYWDGTGWTDHRADKYGPPAVTPGQPSSTPSRGGGSPWWAPWALALVLLLSVGLALSGLDRDDRPARSTTMQQFRDAVNDGVGCSALYSIRNRLDPSSAERLAANERLQLIGCYSSSSSRTDR